jgi:hypothetical protein
MKLFVHAGAAVLVLVTGCARIPRESVTLSQSVGTGIAEQHRAYVQMVNLYFDQKREQIDQWIEQKYLPTFVANVRSELKAAGRDPDAFNEELTTKLIRRVIQRRSEMQSGLEKTRQVLLDQVEANHALLADANRQLTALLESAANVHEADAALAAALTSSTHGKINFDGIDQKLAEYLEAAGDVSKPAANLFEQLQSVINTK